MEKKKKLSNEVIAKIRKEYIPGQHAKDIAKRYGVTGQTIVKYLGELFVSPKKQKTTRPQVVTYEPYQKRVERAMLTKNKVLQVWNSVEIGKETKLVSILKKRTKVYIGVSGVVIQKTDNIIVIKDRKGNIRTITKADLTEYFGKDVRQKAI